MVKLRRYALKNEGIRRMNQSLEFVKKRILSGKCNGMENNNYISWGYKQFDNWIKHWIKHRFDTDHKFYKNNSILFNINSKIPKLNLSIKIKYNQKAEFEYFTMERCVCDGTLYFVDELIQKTFMKVFSFQTYNEAKMPNDFFDDKYNVEFTGLTTGKYELEYTKKFDGQRVKKSGAGAAIGRVETFVMLPIKCDFIIKNQSEKEVLYGKCDTNI